MTNFEKAAEELLSIEGGYSDNPLDSGGKTNYGITKAVARANGYKGPMKDLPKNKALKIYEKNYWDALELPYISVVHYGIAYSMFDIGVNMGIGTAGEFFQRLINSFNDNEEYYSNIPVDGIVGYNTLQAFKSYVNLRGDEGLDIMEKMLECLQGSYYVKLVEDNETQEAFMYGWARLRIKSDYD